MCVTFIEDDDRSLFPNLVKSSGFCPVSFCTFFYFVMNFLIIHQIVTETSISNQWQQFCVYKSDLTKSNLPIVIEN